MAHLLHQKLCNCLMKKHSHIVEFTKWLCFSYQFSSELIQCGSMSVWKKRCSNSKPCSFAYWDNSLYCLLNSFSATSLSACSSEWQNSTAAFISLHLPPIIILSYTESECAQNWTVAFSGSPRLRTVAKDESIKP